MSEFIVTTPEYSTKATRVLKNITSGPVFLQIASTVSDQYPSFLNLESGQSVFYSDWVILDRFSPRYNAELICKYISQGILADTVDIITPPELHISGITGNTVSVTYENNKFTKSSLASSANHLQVYPVISPTNDIIALLYRDVDGVSYSLDKQTVVKITNAGLLYPNEITSVAAQVSNAYDSTVGKLKIWIGTLREGVKSFTIGESIWKSEGADQFIVDEKILNFSGTTRVAYKIRYLFRQSLINPQFLAISDGLTTPIYSHLPGEIEPTYVLSIGNFPQDAGNPITVYTRTSYQEIGSPNAIISDYRVIKKYLYTTAYKYSTTSSARVREQCNIPNSYSVTLNDVVVSTEEQSIDSYVNWVPDLTLTAAVTSPIVDVLDRYPKTLSQSPLAETSGEYVVVSTYKDNTYKINLYEITFTAAVDSSTRTTQIINDPVIGSTINILTNEYSGISTLRDDLNDFVFLSTLTSVYKKNRASWSLTPIISTSTFLTINHSFQFTNISPASYVEGLRGFCLMTTSNRYVYKALMYTDFGLVSCECTTTTQTDLQPKQSTLTYRKELATNYVNWFTGFSFGAAFTASAYKAFQLLYTIPESFGPPLRSFNISGDAVVSNPEQRSMVEKLYFKNYKLSSTDPGIFYNTYNDIITHENKDQYLNGILLEIVKYKKKLSDVVIYRNNNTYDFVVLSNIKNTTAHEKNLWILRDYLLGSVMYQNITLRFRYTETLTDSSSTQQSYDLDFLVFPELSYQVRTVDPAYVRPSYLTTGYGN